MSNIPLASRIWPTEAVHPARPLFLTFRLDWLSAPSDRMWRVARFWYLWNKEFAKSKNQLELSPYQKGLKRERHIFGFHDSLWRRPALSLWLCQVQHLGASHFRSISSPHAVVSTANSDTMKSFQTVSFVFLSLCLRWVTFRRVLCGVTSWVASPRIQRTLARNKSTVCFTRLHFKPSLEPFRTCVSCMSCNHACMVSCSDLNASGEWGP